MEKIKELKELKELAEQVNGANENICTVIKDISIALTNFIPEGSWFMDDKDNGICVCSQQDNTLSIRYNRCIYDIDEYFPNDNNVRYIMKVATSLIGINWEEVFEAVKEHLEDDLDNKKEVLNKLNEFLTKIS